MECARQAKRNRGVIQRREFQFRHHGANEIHARDELLHIVIEQRQFEPAFAIGFGQTPAGSRRVHLALMFVVNHQILKPHQLHGGDSLVSAIEEMLDHGGDLVGKHLLNPLAIHRRG